MVTFFLFCVSQNLLTLVPFFFWSPCRCLWCIMLWTLTLSTSLHLALQLACFWRCEGWRNSRRPTSYPPAKGSLTFIIQYVSAHRRHFSLSPQNQNQYFPRIPTVNSFSVFEMACCALGTLSTRTCQTIQYSLFWNHQMVLILKPTVQPHNVKMSTVIAVHDY